MRVIVTLWAISCDLGDCKLSPFRIVQADREKPEGQCHFSEGTKQP
jgi:hypothetical protein